MKRSRLLWLFSLLMVMALAMAACGGGDDATGTDADTDGLGEAAEVDDPESDMEGDAEADADADSEPAASGEACETITVVVDSNLDRDLQSTEEVRAQFEADHPGTTVEFLPGAQSATDRLGQYLQCFAQECTDFDVMQIDVIWPGDLAEHLVDLTPYVDQSVLDEHFPAIIENNTVDGKLVGIPWFTDAGLLYYRTDMLEKYGYDGPPETWMELTEMAQTIQDGERDDGNQDFQGFVWQGNAYEGLTCDALEWIDSSGGGTIVSSDGTITINNQAAIDALEMAAGWVGTISPTGVTGYAEEDSRNIWHAGNAAFHRNWPYAYGLSFESDALCPDGADGDCLFGASPLPRGEGSDKGAATLGGWQLGVNRYSSCTDLAAELAVAMTSPEAQKARALAQSLIPTVESLYDDPEVLDALPAPEVMKDVLLNATARPSTATAPQYNETSNIFFSNVHEVLRGEQDAEDALAEIELELEELLGFPTGDPQ